MKIKKNFIRGNERIKIISNDGKPYKIPDSWKPVLSRADILVIIPDMHMYLYNTNLDNFKFGAKSMIHFLNHLSILKEEMALEDKTLRIYQLGDLFEQRFPGLHSANATGVEIRMSNPDYDLIVNMMNNMHTHFLYGNHDFENRHFPGFRFAALEGKVHIEHGFIADRWSDFSNPNQFLWEPSQLIFLKIRELNQFFANLLVEAKCIKNDDHYSWGVTSGKIPNYEYLSENDYIKNYGHCLEYYGDRLKKNPEDFDTKICVIGHTHHPFFKTDLDGGKLYIDTGAWSGDRSDFTVITNEELAICSYLRDE